MPTIHHHRVQPEGLTVPMDAYNVQTAFDCGDTIVSYWLPDPPDEPPAEPEVTQYDFDKRLIDADGRVGPWENVPTVPAPWVQKQIDLNGSCRFRLGAKDEGEVEWRRAGVDVEAQAEEVGEESTFQMRNRPIGDGEWDAWREVTLPDASPYRSILERPWSRTLSVDDGSHHFQYRMKPR